MARIELDLHLRGVRERDVDCVAIAPSSFQRDYVFCSVDILAQSLFFPPNDLRCEGVGSRRFGAYNKLGSRECLPRGLQLEVKLQVAGAAFTGFGEASCGCGLRAFQKGTRVGFREETVSTRFQKGLRTF